jgi:hypothetical protein
MLHRVALVRTDDSEKRIGSFIKVTRIGGVRRLPLIANVVPTSLILVPLMMEVIHLSETLVLARATRRNILEDGILHSQNHENLKSYIALTGWAL